VKSIIIVGIILGLGALVVIMAGNYFVIP